MAGANVQYKLRCSLIGHTGDIRAVSTSAQGEVVTASRDTTAKLWVQSDTNGNVYEEKVTYKGHSSYVTSVCLIPQSKDHPDGLTVTAAHNGLVLVFPRYSSDAIKSFTGHSDTVSCLSWISPFLISGSWDHSIKVWLDDKQSSHLNEHTGPIWALKPIEIQKDTGNPVILSASADRTIKLWKNNKVEQTYSGHTDCVRGLCLLPQNRFLSCANDATVRMWDLSGTCLSTFYGHSNFIYCISLIDSSGDFVTGSEDRSIRIWDNAGNTAEVQNMPAQSVWCIDVLPNMDIVAGTSDGICRIFSRAPERQADAIAQADFESSLAQSKIAVEDLGGMKKSEFPEENILHAPGKSDGQTVIVRKGDKLYCYKWSAMKQEWENVGEVVGGSGGSASSSGKVLHEGKEYDFVFSVDIDEGRMLKLPYNKSEDPWMVAQRFINQHELPQDYLDQVAKFICQNAGVSGIPTQSSYVDPFTGTARYIPQGQKTSSNGFSDPFTGAGSYIAPSNDSSPSTDLFPQTTPSLFTNINKEGLLKKFLEANSSVSNKLPEDKLKDLVFSVSSQSLCPDILSSLEPALQWPAENIWPGLDVLRLALRFSNVHDLLFTVGDKGDVICLLLVNYLESSVPMNALLLSMRCISNMAAHPPGCEYLKKYGQTIVTKISQIELANKNIEIGAATAVLNIAVTLRNFDSYDLEDMCQILSASATLILKVKNDDALLRCLITVGTLLTVGQDVKSFAESLDIKSLINHVSTNPVPNVNECAKQILKKL